MRSAAGSWQSRYLSHSHIMCKISQDRGSCSAEEIERNGVTYGVEVKYGWVSSASGGCI